MNRSFDEHDLTEEDFAAIATKTVDGDIAASMVIFSVVGEMLESLSDEDVAALAHLLGGRIAAYLEMAIANLNVWYRDEYPGRIDRVVADAKFSVLTE